MSHTGQIDPIERITHCPICGQRADGRNSEKLAGDLWVYLDCSDHGIMEVDVRQMDV